MLPPDHERALYCLAGEIALQAVSGAVQIISGHKRGGALWEKRKRAFSAG